MLRKFCKFISAVIIVLTLFSSSVFAVTGKVTGNNVRIRERADSKSPEVSVATKGEKVDVIGDEGNWYKVKFETITGYISKDYVDTEYNSNSSNTNENANIDNNTNTDTKQTESENKPDSNNQAQMDVVTAEQVAQEEKNQASIEENIGQDVETTNIDNNVKNYENNQTVNFENDVELRYLPNFLSRNSGTATKGSVYTVKDSLNNWVKVVSDTNSGWVLKTNIEGTIADNQVTVSGLDSLNSEAPTMENTNSNQNGNEETNDSSTMSASRKGKVNVDSARIRKSPNGDALDSLEKGTEVTILSEENDWYHISVREYNSCYIAKRLVTEN